jgi:FtsZ-binding cell division protein ZapB
MSTSSTKTTALDALSAENFELKQNARKLQYEINDLKAQLGHYDRRYERLVKYWVDLTGYEMIEPTFAEAAEKVMQYAARAEEKQLEIDELTELVDQLQVENQWMLAKIGQEGY